MISTYQIRLAKKEDLIFLPDIEKASSVLFPEGRISDPDDAMPMEELAKAEENKLLWVATGADRPVGFAMSKQYEKLLHLAVIAVHPDHGRQGIGKQLVSAVIQQAVARQLSGVTLTTFQDLLWNAPFYAKIGFRILSHTELNAMLRATLAHEETLGMTKRVAMLYPIAV